MTYTLKICGAQHIDGTGERERTVVCVQHSHEKNNCVVKELMNFIVLFYMYLLFEGCKLFLKRVPVDTCSGCYRVSFFYCEMVLI